MGRQFSFYLYHGQYLETGSYSYLAVKDKKMGLLDFLKRRKWEKLGHSLDSEVLLAELRAQYNPSSIYLRDRQYRAIPLKDFLRLVEKYRFPEHKYADEIFDCDDFAVCFMADMRRAWADVARCKEALAFGYVDGHNAHNGMHAWIWHRDDLGVYTWVEAQTNDVMMVAPRSFRIFEG